MSGQCCWTSITFSEEYSQSSLSPVSTGCHLLTFLDQDQENYPQNQVEGSENTLLRWYSVSRLPTTLATNSIEFILAETTMTSRIHFIRFQSAASTKWKIAAHEATGDNNESQVIRLVNHKMSWTIVVSRNETTKVRTRTRPKPCDHQNWDQEQDKLRQ